MLQAALSISKVFLERALRIVIGRRDDLPRRIDAGGPAARFDFRAQIGEELVDGHEHPRNKIRLVVLLDLARPAEQLLEKRRIFLGAPIIMRADVAEVSAVGQRVLRNQINVAAVENRIFGLLAGRNEALTKDHVSRVKAAGIGPTEEHSVPIHFGIDQVATRLFHQLFAQLFVIAQLSVRPFERRRKHVMPKPISEIMPALLVVFPMRHD